MNNAAPEQREAAKLSRITSLNSSQRLRGVIFDMDGVLIDSEPWIAVAAIELFAEKGAVLTHDIFKDYVGMGEDRFLSDMCRIHHLPLDPERDKARLYEIYLERIQNRVGSLQGAREFVAECRRRGLKTAVASSADSVKVQGNLTELAFPPGSFDAVVTGSEIARKKPFPDLFLEAARRIGLECSECLVIEDAIAGIQAGLTAGSICLGISTTFSSEELLQAGARWVAPYLELAPFEVFDW